MKLFLFTVSMIVAVINCHGPTPSKPPDEDPPQPVHQPQVPNSPLKHQLFNVTTLVANKASLGAVFTYIAQNERKAYDKGARSENVHSYLSNARAGCIDNNRNCNYWAGIGECEKNPDYMLVVCSKACGTCGDAETGCIDKNRNCNYWAGIGECEKNPDYMLVGCPKACSTCGDAEPDCIDTNSNCEYWAGIGECDKNPDYMLVSCSKACGICGGPVIVYKYTTNYEEVWNDKKSGGSKDVSIWRAISFENGYCSIGDVAHNLYGPPSANTIMLSAMKTGVLAPPESFTRVYTDKGSGANLDLAVYTMNAPKGYRCLGGITIGNYNHAPDKNKHCCVKNEYTTQGVNVEVYNDKGTGASSDLSLWEVQRGADVHGIEGGNFVPTNTYGRPADGYLLKEDGINVVNVRDINMNNSNPLNLHEVSDIKLVWTDKGSWADEDFSIWRAEQRNEYYSIGDLAVGNHNKPLIAFVLTLSDYNDRDSLRSPTSYKQIWNDEGSGASDDVAIWRPICPAGYESLGYVATDGYEKRPVPGACYCVKGEYISSGNWRKVWDDSGSGADEDVAVYEAFGTADAQQTSKGFGAIASHDGLPGISYLLNKDSVNYIAEPPIQEIEVYNVNYETYAAKIITHPGTSKVTKIINNTNKTQVSTRVITYSYEKSKQWVVSLSITLGVKAEFKAGIPLVAANSVTVSAEVTTTTTVGGSITESEQDQIRAEMEAPAHSQATAWVSYNKYRTNIPYTADIKKTYYDGTTSVGKISGVYKGVDAAEFVVVYGEIESING